MNLMKKDSCAFDKFAIDHEATINYDTSSMKTLDQFTLCLWMRFTKHDGDHVLFTYAGELIVGAVITWLYTHSLSTYKCDLLHKTFSNLSLFLLFFGAISLLLSLLFFSIDYRFPVSATNLSSFYSLGCFKLEKSNISKFNFNKKDIA